MIKKKLKQLRQKFAAVGYDIARAANNAGQYSAESRTRFCRGKRNTLLREYHEFRRSQGRSIHGSYFYARSGDISRVSCTHRRVLHILRVLWSLVTPYGVDGAQRGCASPWEPKKPRSVLHLGLSFSLPSLFFPPWVYRQGPRALLCLGHRRSLHVFFTVCCRVTRFRGFSSNVCRKWSPFISMDSDAWM